MHASARVMTSVAEPSLRDLVLAILSTAAIQGTQRVRLTEFYKAFAGVVESHRDMFPPMRFTKNAHSVYSKRLDDALQSLVGYSIALPNPELQYLELKEDAAQRHLRWLSDKYGTNTIRNIKPIAKEFLKNIAAAER